MIKKDDDAVGHLMSLQCIMEYCLNFANEAMELQSMGDKMSVRVLSMTKFHAGMASEGI
jgi:hypothetical protein